MSINITITEVGLLGWTLFKNSKITPKLPRNQKIKKIKLTCKEASNETSSENKLQLELKNIKNDIFK